ncbi:DNA-binding transcriptional regulator, LysR family [Modicisalibacter muralis]|uniref:DNA-binding transcriptional regulator, LysR family n=1 Tax=Modicisalibacter muralis TaxID=119000 RepID=A0A1G9S115_9GAMM|nr:LysR family transcriptional regulator [Halomonas muralis]SDM29114.1 DNA-binding transcriptional regulator, LysR family [Halomonas muralis]
MDHLTALKVFRQVVELGSFAGAGRHLGLSPPAISKNISELEAHLNVRLLHRTTRRMSLTEAGALYYARVVRILDDLEEADGSLGPLQQTARGLLRISAPMTLTLTCLSTAIPKFLSRYPELSIDLHLDDRRVDIVRDGYDIAIRGSDKLEDSSLIARKLMSLTHVVCGAPAYFERRGIPATPDDLRDHDCVQFTLSGHASEWEFNAAGRSVSVPVDGRYKVTSSLAVRDALCAGFGLSLIPWLYVREDIEQGRLRTVLDDWSSVETGVYAVYPSRRHVVAKVRAFLDFLDAELGNG